MSANSDNVVDEPRHESSQDDVMDHPRSPSNVPVPNPRAEMKQEMGEQGEGGIGPGADGMEEPEEDEVFEIARGRSNSTLALEEPTVSKRPRVHVVNSISSPSSKRTSAAASLTREQIRELREEIEYEDYLNHTLDDDSFVFPEDEIFVNFAKAEGFIGSLSETQRRMFDACDIEQSGVTAVKQATAFVRSLTSRKRMDYDDLFEYVANYNLISLRPGHLTRSKILPPVENELTRRIRWIETRRREEEEMDEARKTIVDVVAVAARGALGALKVPFPAAMEGEKMHKYLNHCRETSAQTHATMPPRSPPHPAPVHQPASIDLEGRMRLMSLDLDVNDTSPPTRLALKEMVTARKIETLRKELIQKNRNFRPELGSRDEDFVFCRIDGTEVSEIPDGLFLYDQDQWREEDAEGEPNPDFESRTKALQDAIDDIDKTENWRNPRQGCVKLVMMTLRVVQQKGTLGYRGLGLLRKEYESDEAFLATFRAIFWLSKNMDEFPLVLPMIRFEVESATLSHRQLAHLLASVFVKRDADGFFNLLDSPNKIAIHKVRAFLEFAVDSVRCRLEGCVSYRVVSRERDHAQKFSSRRNRNLPRVEVEETVDFSEAGAASKLVWAESRLGQRLFQKTQVYEDDIVFLEHPELIIARELHPTIEEHEVVAVIGAVRHCRCTRGPDGRIIRKKLCGDLGTRPMNQTLDGWQRIGHEHVLVDLAKHPTRAIQPQLACDSLIVKLCLSMSSQEHLELPVIAAPPSDGNTNHYLHFVLLLVAAIYSQRPLIYSASGDSAWQTECADFLKELNNRNVNLGSLYDSVMSLRGVDVSEDRLFVEILSKLDQD